jgi:predicted alpha/beta-fold hydrolase
VGHLQKIKVPTFFLNAIDDPIIDPKLYPYKEMENNENIFMATTKRGGHCTHFTGKLRPSQWFPKPFLEFMEFIESKSKTN